LVASKLVAAKSLKLALIFIVVCLGVATQFYDRHNKRSPQYVLVLVLVQ